MEPLITSRDLKLPPNTAAHNISRGVKLTTILVIISISTLLYIAVESRSMNIWTTFQVQIQSSPIIQYGINGKSLVQAENQASTNQISTSQSPIDQKPINQSLINQKTTNQSSIINESTIKSSINHESTNQSSINHESTIKSSTNQNSTNESSSNRPTTTRITESSNETSISDCPLRREFGRRVFNKARAMNVGFREAQKTKAYDCFIFHDIDVVPLNDHMNYSCFEIGPVCLAGAQDRYGYKRLYHDYCGGATAFTSDQFMRMNGFPNNYWGWGGEDDEIGRSWCIRGWLEQDASCPTCRVSLPVNPQPPTQQNAQPNNNNNNNARRFNHMFQFNGGRYARWLPTFSVEVTHNFGLGTGFFRRRPQLSDSQANQAAQRISEMFPQVGFELVLQDLHETNNDQLTIENILEGRITQGGFVNAGDEILSDDSSVTEGSATDSEGIDDDDLFDDGQASTSASTSVNTNTQNIIKHKGEQMIIVQRRRYLENHSQNEDSEQICPNS